MENLTKAAILTSLAFGSAAWADRPNTLSENRGYAACVRALEAEHNSVKVKPTFYLNAYADSREFFLNGHANIEREWRPVRVRCETNRKGHQVLSLSVKEGQYAARVMNSVAQN